MQRALLLLLPRQVPEPLTSHLLLRLQINRTIEELKEKGLWIACADMDGENMYTANLSGAIGIVIGNEGSGVSKLVRKNCDFTVSIPVRGEIESLNASVAAGVLAYEVVRARTM